MPKASAATPMAPKQLVVGTSFLRCGATLLGHLLNTNPAGWNMRAHFASARWDVVALQGNSNLAGTVSGFRGTAEDACAPDNSGRPNGC